jgi:hypothetical protein
MNNGQKMLPCTGEEVPQAAEITRGPEGSQLLK